MSTQGGTVIIQDTVFKNNFTESADGFISSYGGAAYLRGTNLNLTGTYVYDSENPTKIVDSSTNLSVTELVLKILMNMVMAEL